MELLTYAKTDGQAGIVKAIAPSVFGRNYGISANDVASMLAAASAGDDPALVIDDGAWVIVKWPDYQETDPTAADRQKRFRAERSKLSGTRQNRVDKSVSDGNVKRKPVTPLQPLQPVSNGVTRRATETVTYTETDKEKTLSGPKENGRKRRSNLWHIVPADWAGPNDAHRKLATQLGVDCDLEQAKFRDYEFDKPKSDADRAFSNWLRNAAKYKPAPKRTGPKVNEMPQSSAPRTGRPVRADGLDPEAEQVKREREENAAVDAWTAEHSDDARAILEAIAEDMRTDIRWRGTPAGILQGVARGLYRTRVLERINGNGAAVA